jgi:flavorubredoxin
MDGLALLLRGLSEKLAAAGFKIVETIEFKGSPSEEDAHRIRDGVRELLEQS